MTFIAAADTMYSRIDAGVEKGVRVMGIYLNPGDRKFLRAKNSEIYVDKSGMLKYLNRMFGTEQAYICVSRPRRFGKSMAANMISAYYDRTTDAKELFHDMEIAEDESFVRYANQQDVIAINMQKFLSRTHSMAELIMLLQQRVLRELMKEYPDVDYFDPLNLSGCMEEIFAETGRQFVIIIDEWDCIFREYKDRTEEQKEYLDFLREWLKDSSYVGLAYMTGILPIKKYGTHSALNMFDEFSMTNAKELSRYVGFTMAETQGLCQYYERNFDEMREWYNGYRLKETDGGTVQNCSIYNPRSVVMAVRTGICDDYWNQTETFNALQLYIDMNFDGLRDAVLELMAGGMWKIDIRTFNNDMTTFHSMDDVLTLLIHLGYLGYDFDTKSVFIPNKELMDEFVSATAASKWSEIIKSVKRSDNLLQATWQQDAECVAEGIEMAHFETSHIQYNSETALSYTVSLAYYSARQYYTMIRELPTGRGFADIVFMPRPKYADKPALVIELKWNQTAETAIRQIKEKKYVKALEGYSGQVLLVGISYDKETRKHSCEIEISADHETGSQM